MRQRKRGLTFLELLVAMSIAFLSISFLLGLFASATSSSGRARQLSVANFLKQSTMERILAMPLDQLAATSSSYSGQFSEYTYEVDVINPGDFDGDGVPDPELRVLEVTITGPSGFKTKVQTLRKAYDPYYGVAAWQNGKKALVSLADQTGP
ncbi:MAG: hypothetical protein KC910_09865, partial [Candidatus Eremiobacteraeota bacterium]|nr:hypothetical protein [Candidatus Eremiobacteraeota bacterium]